MITFPALPPSGYELTPGAAAPEVISTLAGGSITSLADLVAVGGTLLMSFEGLTETQANSIRSHCASQAGTAFPFSTTTVPADDTPVGFAWIYDAPPQFSDVRAVAGSEFYSVACAFRAIRLRRAVPPSFTARLNITTVAPLALNPTPSFTAALDITTTSPGVVSTWSPTALDLWFENPTSNASWVSQSNGRTLIQSAVGNRPTLDATALNGLPGLTFDGVNDSMQCATAGANGVTNCSMFMVIRYNAAIQDIAAGLGIDPINSGLRGFWRQSGVTQGFATYANDIANSSLDGDNGGNFHIWSIVQNGSSVLIARDGVTASYTLTGGVPTALTNDGAFIAGVSWTAPGGAGVSYFTSATYIAWLVEYRAVSTDNRQRYEGLLADTYWRQRGVAVPLANTHPYYAAGPTI